MTPDELYTRANKEMTMHYENGIRCMETSKTSKETEFYRNYTKGEIEGISDFALNMYLGLIYDFERKDQAEEKRTYTNFYIKLNERAQNLKNLIGDYAKRFL